MATKKRKRSRTAAITVYNRPPPAVARARTVTPIVVARAAPRRRSGGRSASGGGVHHGARVRKGVAIGGAILGYASKNVDAYKKVPQLFGSRLITVALAAHLAADKYRGGYIDHIATAAVALASFNVGRAGSLDGAGALEGDSGDW